jgi:hypothetical protein
MTREITIESIGHRLASIDQRQQTAADRETRTANAESLLLIAHALERIADGPVASILSTLEVPQAQFGEVDGQEVFGLIASDYVQVQIVRTRALAYVPRGLDEIQAMDLAAALLGLDAEVVADWVGQQREDEIVPDLKRDDLGAISPVFPRDFATIKRDDEGAEVDVTWPNEPSVEPDHGTSDEQFDVTFDDDLDAETLPADEDDLDADFAAPATLAEAVERFADQEHSARAIEEGADPLDVFAEEKAAAKARKGKS